MGNAINVHQTSASLEASDYSQSSLQPTAQIKTSSQHIKVQLKLTTDAFYSSSQLKSTNRVRSSRSHLRLALKLPLGIQPQANNPRLTTQTRSSRPKLELAVTLTTQANKAMNGILPTATSASIRSSTGDQAKYSLDLEGEKEKNDLNKSFSKPPIQTTRCWTHTHNASRTETSQRNKTKPAQLDIATSLPPSSNTGR